jgi:cytochrome c oxidase cbb3-type subunit 3
MTSRTLGAIVFSGVLALCGTACTRSAASAEGERVIAYGIPADRAVVNQPLGPVPGVGDIGPVENPLGDDRTVLEEGRKLFVQYNCYGCHGGRAGGGMGPSLRDTAWRYGSSPDRIYNSIAQGRGLGMPSWGALVPDKQLWELTAYVSSLRTPNEPERPQ